MEKIFEVVPRHGSWDVLHNRVSIRLCPHKRDAIRIALRLGRMQLRLGDDAEIVLRDQSGTETANHHFYTSQPR
jgi:hypothetical protein